MARFFIAGTNFPNGRAIIRGRDADHIRVLRLRAGDDIVICDGAGRDYKCRLVQTLEHEAEAEVIEVVPCKAEPTVRTTVFAGLPKGERSDFLVQKCTEAGAAEIVFFSCTRCVAKAVNMEKKLERWQRIAEEAAKQSGRGIIPQVRYEADFVAVLNGALHTDLPLFMYETGERETIRDASTLRSPSHRWPSSQDRRVALPSSRPTWPASSACTSAPWASGSCGARRHRSSRSRR